MSTIRYPFLVPNPPRLSQEFEHLLALESSKNFTNYGPINGRFEQECVRQLFGSVGQCITTCNATVGLMLAIRSVLGSKQYERKFAIMPSFTFPAAAQSALWCGLTPLFCDVDPDTWLPCENSVESLLAANPNKVAVVVPSTTFGNNLNLGFYQRLQETHGIPVVVDAAPSLGSQAIENLQFGSNSSLILVYSMHATKAFATAEGGLIYSADLAQIETLRSMANFGMGPGNEVAYPGLNAKLPEMAAILCLAKLTHLNDIVANRTALARRYQKNLQGFRFQKGIGFQQALAFLPVQLAGRSEEERNHFIFQLSRRGVESRKYFSPALHLQKYFGNHAHFSALPNTELLSQTIVSLPLYDGMTPDQVDEICEIANECR